MSGLIPERLRDYDEPARLIFVHAHPDDESITTGAAMAHHSEVGDHVTLITCTRGELGEVLPTELQELEVGAPTGRNPKHAIDKTGDALAAERTKELANAMGALGVTDYRFLGDENAHDPRIGRRRYKDSGMEWLDNNPAHAPNSYSKDQTYKMPLQVGEEIFASKHHKTRNPSEHHRLLIEEALHLAYVIRTIRPHAIVSYAHDGGYGHPDHIRASEIVCEAVNYAAMKFPEHYYGTLDLPAWPIPLQYFIRDCYPGSHDRVSDDPDGELVAVHATSAQYQKKREAMSAHRTQILLNEKGQYALSNYLWDEIRHDEEYTLVQNPCENLKAYGTYEWSQDIIGSEISETPKVAENMPESSRLIDKGCDRKDSIKAGS